MNGKFIQLAIYSGIFILMGSSLCAQPFSQDSVAVDLHVRNGNTILRDLDITLYQNNDVIYSEKLEKGKTVVKVPLNKYCTMEVAKEGFKEKRVVFDTRYHSFKDYVPVYLFDLELVNLEEVEDTDYGDMDFPVAIVSFSEDCHCLKYNEDYSRYIWELHWQIVNEN